LTFYISKIKIIINALKIYPMKIHHEITTCIRSRCVSVLKYLFIYLAYLLIYLDYNYSVTGKFKNFSVYILLIIIRLIRISASEIGLFSELESCGFRFAYEFRRESLHDWRKKLFTSKKEKTNRNKNWSVENKIIYFISYEIFIIYIYKYTSNQFRRFLSLHFFLMWMW
jgi:hypothetical protein